MKTTMEFEELLEYSKTHKMEEISKMLEPMFIEYQKILRLNAIRTMDADSRYIEKVYKYKRIFVDCTLSELIERMNKLSKEIVSYKEPMMDVDCETNSLKAEWFELVVKSEETAVRNGVTAARGFACDLKSNRIMSKVFARYIEVCECIGNHSSEQD